VAVNTLLHLAVHRKLFGVKEALSNRGSRDGDSACPELSENLAHRNFPVGSGFKWVPERVGDDISSLANECFVTLVRVLVKAERRGHKIDPAAEVLFIEHWIRQCPK